MDKNGPGTGSRGRDRARGCCFGELWGRKAARSRRRAVGGGNAARKAVTRFPAKPHRPLKDPLPTPLLLHVYLAE